MVDVNILVLEIIVTGMVLKMLLWTEGRWGEGYKYTYVKKNNKCLKYSQNLYFYHLKLL